MTYSYPAIFTPEENKMFSVRFPDLPGCVTCGDDITDATKMALDVLCLWLYDMEQNKETIPRPSQQSEVALIDKEFITPIAADTEFYRKFYQNKSVKKSLSIPAWLNEKAINANINFSQLFQKALKTELQIVDEQ